MPGPDLIDLAAGVATVLAALTGFVALLGKWVLQRYLRLWAEWMWTQDARPWDHPRRSWFRPRTRASVLWLLLRPDQRARAPRMSSLAMSTDADDPTMHPDEKLMAHTAKTLVQLHNAQQQAWLEARGGKKAPPVKPRRLTRRTLHEWHQRGHPMSHAVSWKQLFRARLRRHELDRDRERPRQRCICGSIAIMQSLRVEDEHYEKLRCGASGLVLWTSDLSDPRCRVQPDEYPDYRTCLCGAPVHALHIAPHGDGDLWMPNPLGDGRCQPHLRCSRSERPLGGPTPRRR